MNSREAGGRPAIQPDDLVGQAVQRAGRRPEVPPATRAALERATRAAWQAKVKARNVGRRHQRVRSLALAAALLLSAGMAYLLLPAHDWPLGLGRPAIATVEASSDGGYTVGAEMKAGRVVETAANARLALRLAHGVSLRLDADTRLALHATERFTLHRGAVYLDSGPGSAAVVVETPFGTARDIGTQFEVRLEDAGLRVAVREGEVRLERADGTHQALAGTVLNVDAAGHVERGSIPTHGQAWSWVLAATPPFELEGSSMWEFLAWVTRETGWRLDTAAPGLERRLKGIMAHGSVEGLRPDEAIEVVLPGAGLAFEVRDGVLLLEAPSR